MRAMAFAAAAAVVLSSAVAGAEKQGTPPSSAKVTDEPSDAPEPAPDATPTPQTETAPTPAAPSAPSAAPPETPQPKAKAPAEAGGKLVPMPTAAFPHAAKWNDRVYSGVGPWASVDAGAGVAFLEGDPAIVDTRRGTGFGIRVRALLHLSYLVALGARFGHERGSISPPADKDWITHDIAQTSFSGTLRVSPIAYEAFELSAAAYAGVSQSSFRAKRRYAADERDWAGTSPVIGAGVEASVFPPVGRGRFELILYGEAEYRTGDEKRVVPAHESGGLPKSARATLLTGLGLGVHF